MRSAVGVCYGKTSVEEIAGLKVNRGVIAISIVSDNSASINIAGRYCSLWLMSGSSL